MESLNTINMQFTISMWGTNEAPLADYPFNYALFDISRHQATGHTIRYMVESWLTAVRPRHESTNWALGSPQISRISSRYEPRFMPAVTLLMMALPGSPLLYYGDEIGMTDGNYSLIQDQVPYAPMQWNSEANAGFTDEGVIPWIGVANDSSVNNIQMHKDNPTSLLNLIRGAIQLRHIDPEVVDPRETIHMYSLHSMKELIVFVRINHDTTSKQNFVFVANVAEYDVTEDLTLIVTRRELPEVGKVILSVKNVTMIGQSIDLTRVKICSGDVMAAEFKNVPSEH